jgi:ATP-dependent protease ClpP protease subunit
LIRRHRDEHGRPCRRQAPPPIEIHAREIIDIRRRLNEILPQHTSQPFEKVAVNPG